MRICMVSSGFSSIYGGVESVILELSERWVKEGHEVYIISGTGRKNNPDNVKVIKLPYFRSEIFCKVPLLTRVLGASEYEALSLAPFAALSIIALNPDIVLSNRLCETLPSLLLNTPTVMFSQAPILLRLNAFRKVDRVVVNDLGSYDSLNKIGIQTELIMNGVDRASFNQTAPNQLRAQYGISDQSEVILTIARLDANKRISLLIDAFKLIEQDATLIIVGEGPEYPSLKKQASGFRSRNKIIFVKPVPHKQLGAFYQSCDVFSLPSKLEGSPLVLLEALSFGKTVVTNSSPEKNFLLGNFGIYTNVEDAEAYSESLVQAKLKKIDIGSCDYVEHMKRFDWNNIALEYVKMFYKILQKRNKSLKAE